MKRLVVPLAFVLLSSLPAAGQATTVSFCGRALPLDAPHASCDRNVSELDLSPLARLRSLEEVDLGYARTSDLAPLAGLRSLRTVRVRVGPRVSLAPLAGLPLRTLGLSAGRDDGTDLVDLGELGPMPRLERLEVSATRIRGASIASTFVSLRSLRLVGRSVDALPELGPLPHLRELTLSIESLESLPSLRGATRLTMLDVSRSGGQLRDLEGIVGAPALETFVARGQSVLRNLEPLSQLHALRRVDVGATRVENVAPLAGAAHLEVLVLENTPVRDLAPLRGLTSLRRIDLDACARLATVAPLGELASSLREVSARGAPALCDELLALRRRLPEDARVVLDCR